MYHKKHRFNSVSKSKFGLHISFLAFHFGHIWTRKVISDIGVLQYLTYFRAFFGFYTRFNPKYHAYNDYADDENAKPEEAALDW